MHLKGKAEDGQWYAGGCCVYVTVLDYTKLLARRLGSLTHEPELSFYF